ncbi:hypothetical protein PVAND_010703 [Polypedilum vanderplanki]|uniref:Cytochrome P450 n=1 Tax=Polypedilum vanderplanki TaxID=319348 RepID=A0A9J6CGS9_POLVA|nr:hypothetical protein PVAND_010703 [Polypedilum vanderplanki]
MHKGDVALISIYSIHHDPDYYSHPETFNPERFDAEHGGIKEFKEKSLLIPFGSGPRICLGMKWAKLMIKTALVEIIKNFSITVNDQVPNNPKISAKEFMNLTECKLLLNFEKIK